LVNQDLSVRSTVTQTEPPEAVVLTLTRSARVVDQ